MIELHDVGGSEVWVLMRAIDLNYYQNVKQVTSIVNIAYCNIILQCPSRTRPKKTISINPPPCPLTLKMLLHYKREGEEPVRIIDEVATNWKDLGIFLSFTTSELEIISKQHSKPEECCKEMLTKWLDGYTASRQDASPVSWETLLTAIKDARWRILAQKVESFVYSE